jgi:hypothetical protein
MALQDGQPDVPDAFEASRLATTEGANSAASEAGRGRGA